MDTRETERFLGRLFDDGDRFEVAFIGEKVARRERAYTPENLPRVLEEMERAEVGGFNVYVSALPLDVQARSEYDRVWVDQDDPAAPWPFGADENWDAAIWPKPSTLVKTSEAEGGFRWQAIWRLSETLASEDGKDLIKRLAGLAKADGSVHDLRRVLRVPGIINAKRGSMARLIDTSADPVSVETFELPTVTAVDKLLTAQVTAPHHVLGEWLAGVEGGDRARKAYVAARFLKSCQVAYTDAGAILKVGAQRCEPTFDDHELSHALNSAFHRA